MPINGSVGIGLAQGTFTTSSTTAPADVSRTEADHYWRGYSLMPLAGVMAYYELPLSDFANAGGVFTPTEAFPLAPGLVPYVILPTRFKPISFFKDIYCADASVSNPTAFTDAAANIALPDVIIGAAGAVNGLPVGSIITQVNLILLANLLESSAAANYINAAAKTLRIKLSTGNWGANDIVAATMLNGDWYTPASAMSSIAKIYSTDISSVVSGPGTYNISTRTDAGDAIVVLAASLALKGCTTGLRVYYRTP